MLTWSKQYETGVALVDTQHKVLFDHINKLEEIAQSKEVRIGDLDRLVRFLESYVISHFSFEESCMKRFHCPAHEENTRAHAQFLEAFGKLKAEYQTLGPTHAFVTKLHSAASNWIRSHILNVDTKLKSAAPGH